MNEYIHKAHNVSVLLYRYVCPTKYRRVIITDEVDKVLKEILIFDRHANLKYKYGNRKFWARGYYVNTVGGNEKIIREYIQNQLVEDKLADQLSIKEFIRLQVNR